MSDFKFDPFNSDFIAAWHARDLLYAKIADIKTLPVTGDEIKFQFPDIRSNLAIPTGTMLAIPLRRVNETDEEWASRCVNIENIGDLKE